MLYGPIGHRKLYCSVELGGLSPQCSNSKSETIDVIKAPEKIITAGYTNATALNIPVKNFVSKTNLNDLSISQKALINIYTSTAINKTRLTAEIEKALVTNKVLTYQYKIVAAGVRKVTAVFVRIIDNMKAGKIEEEGKFLSWAMQIANSLCIEDTRQITQFTTVHTQPAPGDIVLNSAIVPAVFTNGNTHESHGKIRSLIEMLPEQQREVIVLNYYRGLSFKEISELMKCSLNSALETVRFGLRNLSKLIVEKEVCC